jgi:hypothetical protein
MTEPSRRDRTRPAELIGLAAVLALVLGGVVLLSTRNLLLAVEFAGGGFIVSLVVLAMLLLAVNPPTGRGDDGPSNPH